MKEAKERKGQLICALGQPDNPLKCTTKPKKRSLYSSNRTLLLSHLTNACSSTVARYYEFSCDYTTMLKCLVKLTNEMQSLRICIYRRYTHLVKLIKHSF